MKASSQSQRDWPSMLDYHLHHMELAGLIGIEKETVILTESGKVYGTLIKSQAEKRLR
jgi:hypothetical protein